MHWRVLLVAARGARAFIVAASQNAELQEQARLQAPVGRVVEAAVLYPKRVAVQRPH